MKLSKRNLLHRKKGRRDPRTLDNEKVQETLDWYDEEIEKNPKDTGLYFAKATLLAQEGMYIETIEVLDRIIDLDPDNEKVWYLKAKTMYEMKRYEEALQSYDHILNFVVNDERVWYHRGETFSKLGMFKEAIECYDSAIQIDRNFTEAWLGRGNALRNLRYNDSEDQPDDEINFNEILEDALGSYDRVMEKEPDNAEAWHGKGSVLYELDRLEESLKCFDESIRLDPDYLQSWYDRGLVEQRLGRDEEAIRSFETAVEHYNNNPDIGNHDDLNAIGKSYYKLGRYKESLDFYDDILHKYPKDYHLHEGIGRLFERYGKKREAILHYSKAIELNPNTVYSRMHIGNLLSDSGEFESALENLNEAVSLDPNLEEVWFKLAELLTQKNKIRRARDCYNWILELNPESNKAKIALSFLDELDEDHPAEIQKFYKNEETIISPLQSPLKWSLGSNDHFIKSITPINGNDHFSFSNEPSALMTTIEKGNIKGTEITHHNPYNEPSFENAIWPQHQVNRINTISDEVRKGLDILQKYIRTTVEQLEDFVRGKWLNMDEKNEAATYFVKGKALFEKGLLEKALDNLDSALKINPQCLDAWSVKGDVLLEMGRIEEAQSCYKHAAFSFLRPVRDKVKINTHRYEKKENSWLKTITSLIGDNKEDSIESSHPLINCPKCNYRFDLVDRQCPFCLTFFPEEEFRNKIGGMDDDLAFFENLNYALTQNKPVYIHLDGVNGLIKFLEARENHISGELDYVIIRGDIEKICFDYSFKQ